MALSSTPTRLEIYNQFGSSTKSARINATQKGLRDIYDAATFSTGNQYTRLFFANTDSPSIPVNWASNVVPLNNSISFDIIVSQWGNFPVGFGAKMVIIVQRRVGSSGGFTTIETIDTITNNNNRPHTSTGLQPGTNYQFQLLYYNGFNRETGDHLVSTTYGINTTGLQSIFLTYHASTASTACSAWADPNNYVQYWYSPNGTFSDADFLYTTNAETNPAPNGYYARGTEGNFLSADFYRQVSGGSGELLSGQSSC